MENSMYYKSFFLNDISFIYGIRYGHSIYNNFCRSLRALCKSNFYNLQYSVFALIFWGIFFSEITRQIGWRSPKIDQNSGGILRNACVSCETCLCVTTKIL